MEIELDNDLVQAQIREIKGIKEEVKNILEKKKLSDKKVAKKKQQAQFDEEKELILKLLNAWTW